MTKRIEKIAFIGTGIMGAPMARNLLRQGFAVRVWNRTRAKAEALVEQGAEVGETAEMTWRDADVAILMVDTGETANQLLFGDGAGDPPISSMRANGIVIVMSSIPVAISRSQAQRLKDLGLRYIDAPVSGGEKGAIEATLTMMAGGDADDIEECSALFGAMGRVTRVGDVGAGQLAKLANQMIVGISIGAVAEAMLMAKAGGADLKALHAALQGGFADSTVFRQHGNRMIEENFVPGAYAHVQLKDLATAKTQAESQGQRLPILTLLEHLYRDMCEGDRRELDHSALYLEIADLAAEDDGARQANRDKSSDKSNGDDHVQAR